MTFQPPHVKSFDLLPENAPFTTEQRVWLSGFFAGYLNLDTAAVSALSPSQAQTLLVGAPQEEDAPWHDPAMPIADRLKLAEGRSLKRRMFAAMAQQNCGQCGYLCETYSAAIADGKEDRLNLCAPGGKETLRALRQLKEENSGDIQAKVLLARASPVIDRVSARGISRDNPAHVIFLSRRKLNSDESEKTTYHIEFDISDQLTYKAGDSFGILPKNDPDLVDAVIALIGARPEAEVAGLSLRETLIEKKSLGAAPDSLFQLISLVSGGETRRKARALSQGEDIDGDLHLLDVLGALHKFSGVRLGAEAFVEALDDLQPRLYSISSSPRHQPGVLSLTVDCVRYKLGQRMRAGVASTFLGERVAVGTKVSAYIQSAHQFALPSDPSRDIIMVGPGTGIAPFRAFLQERIATNSTGRNWLFFGHQRMASDFFYQDELSAMQDMGHLNRLTLAWSRDGAEKIYVQDRMRETGSDLWRWLAGGAHFYVCGDAKRMAKDVERALVDIAVQHGAMKSEAAAAFVSELKSQGRYQADVY